MEGSAGSAPIALATFKTFFQASWPGGPTLLEEVHLCGNARDCSAPPNEGCACMYLSSDSSNVSTEADALVSFPMANPISEPFSLVSQIYILP